MNDSEVIRAGGVPITLTDGSKVNVRFGLLAVKQLEEKFGSLSTFEQHLQDAFEQDEDGKPKGRAYGMIWDLLELGLSRHGLTKDELDDLIDSSRIVQYMEAITKALSQGLGGGQAEDPKDKTNPSTSRSRGPRSTTSRPSLSVAATSSSGT